MKAAQIHSRNVIRALGNNSEIVGNIEHRHTEPVALAIGVRGVSQSVANEVEGEDGNNHEHRWKQQPRHTDDCVHVLRALKQDSPADSWRSEAYPKKTQGGLADDHTWYAQCC